MAAVAYFQCIHTMQVGRNPLCCWWMNTFKPNVIILIFPPLHDRAPIVAGLHDVVGHRVGHRFPDLVPSTRFTKRQADSIPHSLGPLPVGVRRVVRQVMLREGELRLKQDEAVLRSEAVAWVVLRVARCKGRDEHGDAVEFKDPACFVHVRFVHALHACRVKVRKHFQDTPYTRSKHLWRSRAVFEVASWWWWLMDGLIDDWLMNDWWMVDEWWWST